MSTDAALLFLSVAAAFLSISAQSTCRNTVHCLCEDKVENFTICAEQNTTAEDPCTQWLGCRSCGSPRGGASTVTNWTPKTRRRRQARQYLRPRRPSYPTGVQSLPQRQRVDGSPRSHFDKYAMWHHEWEYNSYPKTALQNSIWQSDCSEDIDSPKLGSIRCVAGRGEKRCTGTCLPGYTFEGSYGKTEMELSCENGMWTPARFFPPCESGGHCDLVVSGFGRFNCTTGMHGTRCDVFCSSRYAGRFSCYPGRPWEPQLPRCVRPKGGESGTSEGRQPSCRCEYGASCDRDGRCVCPVGRTGTYCESIVAEKQSCSDPGFISNGYRRNLDDTESRRRNTFNDGESLVFVCRSREYALQGAPVLTCRDGEWSESLPSCIKPNVAPERTCPDPGQVANADRLNADGTPAIGVQSYRPGQSVAFTCRRGYALQGPSLIICQTSGSWSNLLPQCSPITPPQPVIRTTTRIPDRSGGIQYCSDPGRVSNGNRVPASAPNSRGFPQGSSLDYSCNQGYTLQGERSIFCLVSGRWSSSIPRCEEQQRQGGNGEYCLNPGNIQNGKITYYPNINSRRGTEATLDDPEYPPGVRLLYSCNEGYRMEGLPEMTCQGDTGLWSNDPPKCTPDNPPDLLYCPNPGSLTNGQRVLFSSINSRQGSPQVNTDDPEYPEGSRFEYSCNAGYTIKGRRSQTCDKGYWSSPKPSCERVSPRDRMFCDNPGPIMNGRVRYIGPGNSGSSVSEDDIEFPEGTRLNYSCEEGFSLTGSSGLTCLPTSHWSSNPPICSPECGRRSTGTIERIFNGTRSLAGEWPWVVAIRDNERSNIICGGAVIDSRTVVTAAHCLTGSDSYLVYFGKVKKLDKDDDDQVMAMRSSRTILHPDYSEDNMESDIGLIYFSQRIPFTDRIKPVCLPDTSSTAKNLRTGSRGFVTGFGEDEFGLQPNNLMKMRIPVQDNEVCIEYYRREGIPLVMSQNMFCAGYANGSQATCEGDSGSPLVFYDRTADRYTVEGLVSFGTNGQCGVQGLYTVFTKVFPFVPWILTNLA